MPVTTLIKDGEKYGGNYVATRSFKDRSVVSYGTDPIKVFDEAKKKGVKDPVVIYVPKRGKLQFFNLLYKTSLILCQLPCLPITI